MRVVVLQGFHDSKFCLSISPGQVDFSAGQQDYSYLLFVVDFLTKFERWFLL